MDVLKDKNYEQYNYTSRYTVIPYYYNTLDGKYIYGVAKNLLTDTSFVAHHVLDADTLDGLALKYYNNPTYWWVIADFNRILDPYIKLSDHYQIVNIPNISSIEFGDLR